MMWSQLGRINHLHLASRCHQRIDFDLKRFFVKIMIRIGEPCSMVLMVDLLPRVGVVDVCPESGSEIMVHQ